MAQTSNDEVDEQKKNRHQLQTLVCKANSMGSIFLKSHLKTNYFKKQDFMVFINKFIYWQSIGRAVITVEYSFGLSNVISFPCVNNKAQALIFFLHQS